MSRRVLVVDDESRVREVVASYLVRDGFEVRQAGDGANARRLGVDFKPDLVVLDVKFPGASGLDRLAELRSFDPPTPVILLTALAEEENRVAGLELGADDYVIKPFSPRELVARVRSVLRRARPGAFAHGPIVHGSLRIDPGARRVELDGEGVELAAREFDLLVFLASNPGRVFSRADLLEQVWDSSPEWQDPATVTVHVRRLRQKLETDSTQPQRLKTVWGVGYRFDP